MRPVKGEVRFKQQSGVGVQYGKPIKVSDLSDEIVSAIEYYFQNAEDYSLFSGCTLSGRECGFYGFRHNNSIPSSVIIFSRENTYIGIRDPERKSWNQYLIK